MHDFVKYGDWFLDPSLRTREHRQKYFCGIFSNLLDIEARRAYVWLDMGFGLLIGPVEVLLSINTYNYRTTANPHT
jgi:hypothetical protein